MVINKYKDIILNKYAACDEDSRLRKDCVHNIEYKDFSDLLLTQNISGKQ